MKIALTGTPGTGKSSAARLVDRGFGIVDINALAREGYSLGTDPERGSLIVDLDRLADYIDRLRGDYIIEGHVAHLLPSDLVVVLRTAPAVLRERLAERGWSPAKVAENVEAEALDVILVEALELNRRVYEIDTTGLTPAETAQAVREIAGGTDKYKPGSVDFSEELCP